MITLLPPILAPDVGFENMFEPIMIVDDSTGIVALGGFVAEWYSILEPIITAPLLSIING